MLAANAVYCVSCFFQCCRGTGPLQLLPHPARGAGGGADASKVPFYPMGTGRKDPLCAPPDLACSLVPHCVATIVLRERRQGYAVACSHRQVTAFRCLTYICAPLIKFSWQRFVQMDYLLFLTFVFFTTGTTFFACFFACFFAIFSAFTSISVASVSLLNLDAPCRKRQVPISSDCFSHCEHSFRQKPRGQQREYTQNPLRNTHILYCRIMIRKLLQLHL